MSEWDFAGNIASGATGRQARLVQEWLSLQGFKVSVDGQFGPATEVAVRAFQKARGLQTGGVVNGTTFAALVAPMVAALAPINPGSRSLGALTLAYAKQHLAQSPREVGGENMGPWVRLYMKGNEGAEWAWCAGFVGYVLRQAAKTLGVSVPLPYTFSCDSLAAAAKEAGIFLDGRSGVSPSQLSPGSLFLVRRTPLDWVHTGLVLSISPAAFETIEGNTNDSGDREGYEVCRRTRGYDGKDFVVIA
jgi:peptidoglycan hydrolase-like protein with peptidoglycan-binding domain